MVAIDEAKRKVVQAGMKLVESGLIARTWGNVSHRINEDQFVITPSGRNYHSLTPEDIVTVQIADCSYSGTTKPSSEKGVHAEVYRLFPDIQFVIHTHQEYASVISACGLDAIQLEEADPRLADKVICAAYALPSTKKLRKHVAAALTLSKGKAVIMKNHGALCFGIDDEEAFHVALELEKTCENYLIAKYLKLSGTKDADPYKMSQFALAASGAYIDKRTGFSEKNFYHSRRTENGFLLYTDSTEIEIRSNELHASLPEEAQIYQTIYNQYRHINHILWNVTPEIQAISNTNIPLKPLLDDFAQIVGTSTKNVENMPSAITNGLKRASVVFIRNKGALCCGSTEEDAFAVGMVLEKNSKAHIGASLFGTVKTIRPLESLLMRFVYLKKYSKQVRKRV